MCREAIYLVEHPLTVDVIEIEKLQKGEEH
jgi:hypothetical protein